MDPYIDDLKVELGADNDKLEVNNEEHEVDNDEIKLAKKLQLDLNEIPVCLKQRAARILEVLDRIPDDDPIVVIDWRNPWPRGRSQTKRILTENIINGGGVNEFNSDTIFSFRTCRQLGNWINNRPQWSKHDRSAIDPNPDVGHMYRINKVTDHIAEFEDAAYVFND
ncbi:unnamed protein product [Rhizophagus irregularis]|uniref:Uncharacterized protein n=1 Tax=Rhizophagus irregularis TaxID=588596 RepID=A0A2N1NZ35_9GLOM|nr:hypothetical protein RhiirC2_842841 [Rhizophagus irregularis]CAB4377163.1 unnamed protein product [Rhizophagus irregularis]CAB5394275.1 unnamed protein product [Rhizophagus irregularis]